MRFKACTAWPTSCAAIRPTKPAAPLSSARRAALREVVAPSRQEPGCVAIGAYRSTRDPRLFYIHSRWIDEVLAANPRQLEQYRAGKKTMLGFFVGQVMKASKGQASPQVVNELLTKKLG